MTVLKLKRNILIQFSAFQHLVLSTNFHKRLMNWFSNQKVDVKKINKKKNHTPITETLFYTLCVSESPMKSLLEDSGGAASTGFRFTEKYVHSQEHYFFCYDELPTKQL